MDSSWSKWTILKQWKNYLVSSALSPAEGAITLPELLPHGSTTPLIFTNGLLKRYLKETVYVSFPLLCLRFSLEACCLLIF